MRQLSAIFLIILIAGSSAATLQSKLQNKQSIISDIQDKNSQFYQLLEEGSQYVVDEVLGLLKNLEDAAKKDLFNLNAAWAIEKKLLEDVQEQSKRAYNKQVVECNRLQSEQHSLEQAIRVREQETQDNKAQISKDANKVKILKEERCKSNNIYIDHIVDHRDAILLFGVLRKAIEQYQPGSFIQLGKFQQDVANLGDYINMFAKSHTSEFNQIMGQLKQVDSKFKSGQVEAKVNNYAGQAVYQGVDKVKQRENIGKGHVDNKKDQIKVDKLSQDTVRSLANIKGQLLKVLDEITSVENKKQKSLEKGESDSNEAAATYKKQLQDEQRKLTRRNEVLAQEIATLKVRLASKIQQVQSCRQQEARLLAAYQKAQKNLIDATSRYEARKAVLNSEIQLFARLYVYYREKVYAVATQADRQRVQDYADNKSFKNSQGYTKKSASEYNSLKGNVDKTLTNEAVKSVDNSKF